MVGVVSVAQMLDTRRSPKTFARFSPCEPKQSLAVANLGRILILTPHTGDGQHKKRPRARFCCASQPASTAADKAKENCKKLPWD